MTAETIEQAAESQKAEINKRIEDAWQEFTRSELPLTMRLAFLHGFIAGNRINIAMQTELIRVIGEQPKAERLAESGVGK